MIYPLRRSTTSSRVRQNTQGVADEKRKPNMPGPYIYVSGGTGGTSTRETWQSPEWTNSFTFISGRDVGFRHGLDGDPEFIGQLDLTQGAVTGTAAFTLPTAWRANSFEFPFPIWIGGNDWISGIFAVNPNADGDCFVYWPTQAIQI